MTASTKKSIGAIIRSMSCLNVNIDPNFKVRVVMGMKLDST